VAAWLWTTAKRPVPGRIVAGLELMIPLLFGPFRAASSPGWS
jgi:hypothetical protein